MPFIHFLRALLVSGNIFGILFLLTVYRTISCRDGTRPKLSFCAPLETAAALKLLRSLCSIACIATYGALVHDLAVASPTDRYKVEHIWGVSFWLLVSAEGISLLALLFLCVE